MPHTHHYQRRQFSVTTLFWVLCLILALILIAFIKQSGREKNMDASNQELTSEVADLARQNQELEQLIAYFGSSEFVEKEAREKLNMARPGEKTLIITDPNSLINLPTNQTPKSMPQKWWQYFFGK